MTELEIQNKRAELLGRIPLLEKIEEPNYAPVMEQMDTLVWEEIEDMGRMPPASSCKMPNGVYGIFATDAANGLAYEHLKVHEAGHCLMQHFKDNWYKDQQAARQIKSKWSKFKEHIDIEGNNEDDITEDFIHMLRNITQDLEINGKYWPDAAHFNEVQQRISDASLVRFIEHATEEQLESTEKWMNEKPEEIHQWSKGVYPADFGFPNGLTWMGYLHLILTQPNEFMEQLNNQVDEMQRQQAEQQQREEQQGQQGQGQGQHSQGNGQGQGQGQGSGNGQGQGQSGGQQQGQDNNQGGLKEDQTQIFEHHSEDGTKEGRKKEEDGQNGQDGNGNNGDKQQGNGNGNQQNGNGDGQNSENGNQQGGKSKLKNGGKPDNNGSKNGDGEGNGGKDKMKASVVKANSRNGDKGNQEMQQAMAARAQAGQQGDNGQPAQAVSAAGSGGDDADDWSAPGDGSSNTLVDATPTMRLDRSVMKFIEKCCIGKTVQRDRQDPLYNYNRGKTSGGVMRTRITTVEEYRPGNLVAVIDVSGSVDIELVKALLSEVLKYKSKFGTKSRIILWDTGLVDDLPLKRSNLEAICCGGGTSIARGIEYAKKYLKSEQDKLCVISDFEDYLQEWDEALCGIKGDTFAVNWGSYNGAEALKKAASNKRQQVAADKMKVINVR